MPQQPDPKRLAQQGVYFDEDGNPVSVIDPEGGFAVYDEFNHAVHNGEAFGFDADGSIPANTSLLFLGIVGTKQVHFEAFEGRFSAGNVRIELFEAPTITTNGTLQTPYRLNRAIPNVSSLTVYSNPTVSANGTKFGGEFLPLSGGGANTNPAEGGVAGGRVLKEGTAYLFKITNTDLNTAVSFGATFLWHDSSVILV